MQDPCWGNISRRFQTAKSWIQTWCCKWPNFSHFIVDCMQEGKKIAVCTSMYLWALCHRGKGACHFCHWGDHSVLPASWSLQRKKEGSVQGGIWYSSCLPAQFMPSASFWSGQVPVCYPLFMRLFSNNKGMFEWGTPGWNPFFWRGAVGWFLPPIFPSKSWALIFTYYNHSSIHAPIM